MPDPERRNITYEIAGGLFLFGLITMIAANGGKEHQILRTTSDALFGGGVVLAIYEYFCGTIS